MFACADQSLVHIPVVTRIEVTNEIIFNITVFLQFDLQEQKLILQQHETCHAKTVV